MLCKYATLFWYLCITYIFVLSNVLMQIVGVFKAWIFLYLLYEYTSYKGPFNNYVDQILTNSDPFPTPLGWTSLDFWMTRFLKLGSQCSATAIATAVIRQFFATL